MHIRILHTLILTAALLTAPLAPAATTCQRPAAAPASREQAAALAAWSATIAQHSAPAAAVIEARIRRAETYRTLGRYADAEADLMTVLKSPPPPLFQRGEKEKPPVDKSPQPPLLKGEEKPPFEKGGLGGFEIGQLGFSTLHATATTALGLLYAQQRQFARAETQLRDALNQARELADPTLIATAANSLGNVLLEQQHQPAASAVYREALAQARAANDPGLIASISINLARVAGNSAQAQRELQTAHAATQQITIAAERAELLLALAARARESGSGLARDSLLEAEQIAAGAGLARLHAQALAQLSALAAASGQSDEAQNLLAQALRFAPLEAYDLRYQWEWQLGQWLRDAGERPRAIAAYRRAVAHLQHIRLDIPVEYAAGRSSFRETLAPLYLGLADLLFQEAAQRGDAAQPLLREARDTVEQVKLDELRDYFRDACILPLREDIGALASRSAVFYPVIFAERVELLVSIGERFYRTTAPVSREQIQMVAEILALKLRYNKPAEAESTQLYDWLIAPIVPWLTEQRVETLVFVPDGPLRAVPLAALRASDGRYLVESYAVATVPGLKLLPPDDTAHADLTTLLAGLSRPGPVVDELPAWWVNALVQQNRGHQSPPAPLFQRGEKEKPPFSKGGLGGFDRRGVSASAQQLTAEPLRAAQVEKIEALALPGVAEEIKQLSARLPGRTLRDQEFLLKRFVAEVGGQPYRVVHIASHGLFQGPPEDNFIVTYDRKLDMKTLAKILKPKEFAQRPIELLVLSACQTAEGDDRTPLGLSGVALQSGARSALGSLWPVGDAATQLLMQQFYEQLKQPGMTKGRALQAAQKALLASDQYRQPNDWAAFILVGNWL
ncbi:CHAT domain-containing protein [Chromatium okenii]|uniref:CHAT domain-containing protein n=1 Tax=Chromatium okenii TaxID=61644 RepID=UPI0026ED1082|nr:CHAT domain-containing protein [Chromatium okenii]MBV5309478.1 CHAT domain-containing protein [Chromatium okenii]